MAIHAERVHVAICCKQYRSGMNLRSRPVLDLEESMNTTLFAFITFTVFRLCPDLPSDALHRLQASSPTPMELADHVRDVYENARFLRFEQHVEQGGIKPGGELSLFRESVRSMVWMGPRRLRLEVRLPKQDAPVFTLIDDGERLVQWSSDEWCKEPSGTPPLERYQHVAKDRIDACLFGNLMSSWLGEHCYQAEYFHQTISEGKYIGLDSVEGRPCHVVLQERMSDGHFMARNCFYIDAERYLVVRWRSSQTTYDLQGRLVQDITRIRTLTDLRTESFDDSVFHVAPPPGTRRIELAKPSEPDAKSSSIPIPSKDKAK